MITVVQLRVLRTMVGTNVFLSRFGEAFFEKSSGDVRKQTVLSLEKKGLVEEIAGHRPAWRGTEYQITDAGREVVGVPVVVGEELVGFASSAIRRVFDDTSALDEQTLGSLELLRDEIDLLIDVVRESMDVGSAGLVICLKEDVPCGT